MEVTTILVVVGILATQAVYNASVQQKKARRTEVTLGLDALRDAQRAFRAEHGRYAGTFDELTFGIEGSYRVSATVLRGRRYVYSLSQPWGEKSYYVVATGQIDSDGFPDTVILEAGRP